MLGQVLLTSNGKLRATSDELQEFATLHGLKAAHRLEQIPHRLAVHVVAMIGLDGVKESYCIVSDARQLHVFHWNLLSMDQSSSTRPKRFTSSSGVKALKAE